MSETIGTYIPSKLENVPEKLGWAVNSPEFANRAKLAFVKLTLEANPVVLRFLESNEQDNAGYKTINYDERNQSEYLGLGSYFNEKEPHGYLMGFPILTEIQKKDKMLGIEIWGDPNDIYSTNAVFLMKDVVRLGIAAQEQVQCLYRLENELVDSVPDDMTRFVHPTPILLDRISGEKVYRPMTLAERDVMRLSLPVSYDYMQPE